jgi:prolyl-tRNA editing enzyme YbaK/EbsC (Cys-tRNA(Pro) deacylase)
MARMEALPVDENHLTYEFTARPAGKDPRRIRSSVFVERNKQGHPVRLVGITRRLD